MQCVVNGESVEATAATLGQLLIDLGYEEKKVVVALNETFVPNSDWPSCSINPGDRLEILAAIAGG